MPLKEEPVESGPTVDPRLSDAIPSHLTGGRLTCEDAFAIAEELDASPLAVGQAADVLQVRLARCQLGYFGYAQKQGFAEAGTAQEPVPEGLTEAILAARTREGSVTCAALWRVAEAFQVSRLLVGYVTDQLGIQATACQLGAF